MSRREALSASSTCRRWSSSKRVSPSSSSAPRAVASGVRISWLMAARNRDFAWALASAAALASLSANVSRCSRVTSAR
ncbi:hypothetical protein FQZ97_769780 [compost metagenome]